MSLEEGCLKKKPEIYLNESVGITIEALKKARERMDSMPHVSNTTMIVSPNYWTQLDLHYRREAGLDKCNKCGSDLRVIIEAHDSYTVEPCVKCKMGDICD